MQDVRTQSAEFTRGRSIIARILPGTDLISGIEKTCTDHAITTGAIVSAIGTLTHATVVYVVPVQSTPLGVAYVPPKRIEGPLELLSGQGTIGQTRDNRLSIHLHGSVSAPDMKIYGGHLLVGGNPVLATAEVWIQESIGVTMLREKDPETEFELFKFYTEGEHTNG